MFRLNLTYILDCGLIQASDRANVTCEPAPSLISPVTAISKELAIARSTPDLEYAENAEYNGGNDSLATDKSDEFREIEGLKKPTSLNE